MIRQLATFMKFKFKTKVLYLETFMFLSISKIAIVIFPFKILANILGKGRLPTTQKIEAKHPDHIALTNTIKKIGDCLPWSSACLDRAVAAKWMLKTRGVDSLLFLGLKNNCKDHLKLNAHAWLTVDGMWVTGGGQRGHQTIRAFG